jgi:hypothetical protein
MYHKVFTLPCIGLDQHQKVTQNPLEGEIQQLYASTRTLKSHYVLKFRRTHSLLCQFNFVVKLQVKKVNYISWSDSESGRRGALKQMLLDI